MNILQAVKKSPAYQQSSWRCLQHFSMTVNDATQKNLGLSANINLMGNSLHFLP